MRHRLLLCRVLRLYCPFFLVARLSAACSSSRLHRSLSFSHNLVVCWFSRFSSSVLLVVCAARSSLAHIPQPGHEPGSLDAKNRDAKNRGAKNRDAENRDAKNRDAKNRDAKNRDAKNRDAKNRSRKREGEKRERERERGARTQCSSRRGRCTLRRCCPPGGGGVVILFYFRGKVLPESNLSLIWALSKHFEACLTSERASQIAWLTFWKKSNVGASTSVFRSNIKCTLPGNSNAFLQCFSGHI